MATLVKVIKRPKGRFAIGRICVVSDRGMSSVETMTYLAGRYREVHPEGVSVKDPSLLKVKEAIVDGNRYVVCLNERQARNDAKELWQVEQVFRDMKVVPRTSSRNASVEIGRAIF